MLPLLFIAMNMAFNISVLNLVKMSTALVASLTATLAGIVVCGHFLRKRMLKYWLQLGVFGN